MITTAYIGASAPYGEQPIMVGCANYVGLATDEANRFIAQIRKYYGDEPGLSVLEITKSLHEFGVYVSVEYRYDDESKDHRKYVDSLEVDNKDALESWDESVVLPESVDGELTFAEKLRIAKDWGFEDVEYE